MHERGTLEWKQLRVMIAQATGQEVTDNLICGVLDRPIVFDLLRKGGGQQHVEDLSRLVSRPGHWLPVLVITRDGMFRTCAVETP